MPKQWSQVTLRNERRVSDGEERVKLVYAVKVAIVGDDALALKPGVPADVVLLTGPDD